MASYMTTDGICANIGPIEVMVVTGTRRTFMFFTVLLRKIGSILSYETRWSHPYGWTIYIPPEPPPAPPGLFADNADTQAILSCMKSRRSSGILGDPDVAKARIQFTESSAPHGSSAHGRTMRLEDLPPHARAAIPGGPDFSSNEFGIALDLARIRRYTEPEVHVSYRQYLAEVVIHELVHVRLYMRGEHPDMPEDGSHPIGDAIYQEAWAWYKSTFGVPAPGSKRYNPAIDGRWLPRCLRD